MPRDHRDLIHRLNQRYRQQWERAERLQAELDDIRRSRAWRILGWLRRVRAWFRRVPPGPAATTDFVTQELTDLPVEPAGHVSILIPFRNAPWLLRAALRGLQATAYRRFELVLIDNGSTCPATRRYVDRLARRKGIRVARCPGPFNFARLCNAGAERARGDFLLFLNNDTEVLTPEWLGQLVRVGLHPRVGVVGATLLYADGTLQHAGIFPQGGGRWTHAYRGYPSDHPGRRGELLRVRAVPAVTGACLLIRRHLFAALGGFRPEFPVTGNDVDLCCRVRQRGLLVAVTPHARLLHAESLSRGYSVESPPGLPDGNDLSP
jgi:GT2 family glycosyltransferase